MSLALAPFEVDGHKVNLIDTPGYADFVGDVAAASRAVDLVVCVVSAVEGVEVQTEVTWKMAEERGIPRVIFINKLDRERASFAAHARPAQGSSSAPASLHSSFPIGEEAEFRGVIDLLNDTAMMYDGSSPEGHRRDRCPTRWRPRSTRSTTRSSKGIVVGDDDLMERYLGRRDDRAEELARALAEGHRDATVFPVLCGSATKLVGIDRLARVPRRGGTRTPPRR